MKFIENIDTIEYEKFLDKCSYRNFLQTKEWGEFCSIGKNKKPYYIGVTDDNDNLLCATMMQKTNLLFGYSYMYAPRGFVMDYPNEDVLAFFTENLKTFLKKQKCVYLTVDPAIMYQQLDTSANIVENGKNNYDIFNSFIKLGYKHKGFTKNYESNQPRYTFIVPLEYDSFDEVYQKFSKSMRQNIKRAGDLGVEVEKSEDIMTFYELISSTGKRDDFHPFSLSYYESFYRIFKNNNKCELFISYIYPPKILKQIEVLKKQNENKPSSIAKLDKMAEKYNNITDKKIPVNAHIIVKDGDKATALYAGNNNAYADTYANYLTYYTKIKYAYEHGCKEIDLYGVTGDPKTKYKNLAGIFEFKKQFGGNLIEYFGDFDLVIHPLLYKVLPFAIKMYHLIRK